MGAKVWQWLLEYKHCCFRFVSILLPFCFHLLLRSEYESLAGVVGDGGVVPF